MPSPAAGPVLVTGAPGWLGTRLVACVRGGLADGPPVPACFEGAEVRCLVHRRAGASRLEAVPGVTVVPGDLTAPDSLERFFTAARGATVFHCAGVIHPRRTREFDAVNAEGTRHLVTAAVRAGVARLVHVSSNSPFGANPTPFDRFTEEAPYRPYRGYGRSKMAAEQVVRAAGARGDLEAVIVRAPWFYGPGQPPRQTQFFSMIRAGRFPLFAGGANRRSMAYIDNLCEGLLLAAATPAAAGRTYWIADERPYAMAEIVETIERVMARDFRLPIANRRMFLPRVVSHAARVADGLLQAVGLYDQRVHVLSELDMTIACSVDRAARELGYRPRIGLEEGMRRSLAWLRERGVEV